MMRADLLQRDELLTAAEAASYLRIHPREFRRMVAEREIAVVRRGDRGHIRIRLSELNRWVRRNERPARRSLAAGE